MPKSLALITGASSGIGYALAEHMAAQGHSLILTARRDDRLKKLKQKLCKNSKVSVDIFKHDVRDFAGLQKLYSKNKKLFDQVEILVNNAGCALGLEELAESAIENMEATIDINIKGLLYFTRAFLPHWLKRNSGHIINLGSIAGYYVYPKGAVYCASKFAVRAITEALRLELLGTRIRVSEIDPGRVETEFSEVRFKGDKARAKKVYEGYEPLLAHDIAETIYFCISRPAHVNIQSMMIYPTDQAGVQVKVTPKSR